MGGESVLLGRSDSITISVGIVRNGLSQWKGGQGVRPSAFYMYEERLKILGAQCLENDDANIVAEIFIVCLGLEKSRDFSRSTN